VQNLDARHLELLSEKTRAASDGRVGGPVLGLWTFQAKEPGSTEIKMDYYRKWGRGREGHRKIPGEDYHRLSKKNGTQMNADRRRSYFAKRLNGTRMNTDKNA
jgi:hypothetical protein